MLTLGWTDPSDAEPLLVVAATPDLKSLVEAVGGDQVRVETLVPPGADAEAFEVRPSHLAALKKADLVVRVGLGYDDWLDKLLQQNGIPKLMRGGDGYVDASVGIPLLEVQGRSVDVLAGHPHGLANPHYWLDPANSRTITAAIAEALIRSQPEAQSTLIANRDRLLTDLDERLHHWQQMLEPYRGAALIAYHNAWPYFARRFRLNIVAVIEPKEGVEPAAGRLATIAATMRAQQVRAILQDAYAPDGPARMLSARSDARVAVMAPSVGAVAAARDYLALFDYDVDALAHALAGDD
jgi:ABC-type Zn uptake system ZnuABC Zn-binding protein ZnuA